tara:strand:- start:16 stop:693 length:678 start_codon:yes stop_codon:yes gene_type:complete
LSGKDLTVTFQKGDIHLIDSNQTDLVYPFCDNGQQIDNQHFISTANGSRFELKSNDIIWRIGSQSFVKFETENQIWIHSGSLLICLENEKSITFKSRISEATFSGKGTIIIESLENGGFKFIPLEGEGVLKTEMDEPFSVLGGRLILVLGSPSYLGSSYDIDLMLLLQSSKLINYFPTSLSTFDQIGLALYIQQLKLKGKYNALIGDAHTNDELQIWAFGDEADQ